MTVDCRKFYEDLDIGPLLKRGTQIIYVPLHCEGDITHPDAEPGFVTSVRPEYDIVYCRYWSQDDPNELRTRLNSEATPFDALVVIRTRPQREVEIAIERWCDL